MRRFQYGFLILIQILIFTSKIESRKLHARLDADGYIVVSNGTYSPDDLPIVVGSFDNKIDKIGWAILEAKTNSKYDDSIQAYALGYLEGYLSGELITLHWQNVIGDFCEGQKEFCEEFKKFFSINFNFMAQQVKESRSKDKYWHQVGLLLEQLTGLQDGYKKLRSKVRIDVDIFGIFILQLLGDSEDLGSILKKSKFKKVLGSGSCSALIKPLPNNTDLLVSHVTWNSLQSMLRIIKNVQLNVHETADSKSPLIAGLWSSYSSYPGSLQSGDDFYLISSGLVTLETTIGNGNQDLYQNIKPEAIVLEWIRSMVANRLATSGKEWADIFSRFNSGTYNNQWMIIDYKLFRPHSPLKDGTLTILEQLPTFIKYEDMTHLLRSQGYWPSYNVPFFKEVFNLSGAPERVAKYGDWFTYEKTPRALIFKRDQSKVVDMASMIKLMRSNDYKHDPFSRCECNPPYSGENAISARSDLNLENGTYPFQALGLRSHAATDMKVTSYDLYKKGQRFIAQSGPTFDNVPAFDWSTSFYREKVSHAGHPQIWKFEPIKLKWNFQ